MKRRTYLKSMLAVVASASVATARSPEIPVQLHVDLVVDPARENEMLHNFETIFRPEAVKHPGYIDAKMLKLRKALHGSAPASVNYRFTLTYESEDLRQKWVASPEHKRVWPAIVNTLSSKDFTALLFDVV